MAKLNPELFAQLGGVNWVAREGFFIEPVKQAVSEQASSEASLIKPEELEPKMPESTVHESEMLKASAEPENTAPENLAVGLFVDKSDAYPTGVVKQSETPQTVEQNHLNAPAVQPLENGVIVLGSGLDNIWQDESQAAWRLWQNIMQAFSWDESQVVFFDLELLVSDEMVAATMDEIINLGVDWVMTMDSEHPINELLIDGVQLIEVPDFESMLFDPFAKQSFYRAVMELPSFN